MKGLLVKDFRFVLGQKSFMIIFLVLALFFLISGQDISFAIVYCMMMAAIFSTSSISYDNFENGMAFMLTLPIQKKTYVVSKYIFSLLVIVIIGALVCLLAFGCNSFGITELVLEGMAEIFMGGVAAAILMISLMIPIYIIFGAEKARTAILVIVGVVVAGAFIVDKFFLTDESKGKIAEWIAKLGNLSDVQAVLLIAGALVVVLAISVIISMKGLAKKEY